MELGGGGVVDGEGGEEVALNDGVQALEVDVFGENAFGGEFVHQRVGIVEWRMDKTSVDEFVENPSFSST
jgi:hypothetical protein